MRKSIMSQPPAAPDFAHISGMAPAGILAQEARGQALFNAVDQLPRQIDGVTRAQLEAVGFKFGKDVDNLFVEATLPPGWTKKATGHSMHTDLLDEQGRKRGGIFYKAALYDQRADMHLVPRFRVSSYEDGGAKEVFQVCVMKGDEKVKAFGIWARPDYDKLNELEETARAWLLETYPDCKNPFAYWN